MGGGSRHRLTSRDTGVDDRVAAGSRCRPRRRGPACHASTMSAGISPSLCTWRRPRVTAEDIGGDGLTSGPLRNSAGPAPSPARGGEDHLDVPDVAGQPMLGRATTMPRAISAVASRRTRDADASTPAQQPLPVRCSSRQRQGMKRVHVPGSQGDHMYDFTLHYRASTEHLVGDPAAKTSAKRDPHLARRWQRGCSSYGR
jgi:hypothetical protein